MNKKTVIIARTGMIIALAVVIQMFGGSVLAAMGPNKVFITGSLINACLIIATATGGLISGAAISFITPLVAGVTNHSAAAAFILPFSPVIGVGNFIFVLFYWLFTRKRKDENFSMYTGLGLGAFVKYTFLYMGASIGLNMVDLAGPLKQVLAFMFGWPQLATAVAGGILAFFVIKMLKPSQKV